MSIDIGLQEKFPRDELRFEDPRYLREQLITYIGNKRSLLEPIETAVKEVRAQLGGRKLMVLDAFSGSGVISRMMKSHATMIVANDIEEYAQVVSECYLTNARDIDWHSLSDAVHQTNQRVDETPTSGGFIERLYAPTNDEDIKLGERVFYTRDNARRLDNYVQVLSSVDSRTRTLLMGPLMASASVHANTAGVFKGFYKDKNTGLGRFGGSGQDALMRIKGKIECSLPVLSQFNADSLVLQTDANAIPAEHGGFDLAYLDPPYNQHPYGSNYFMLNLLANYREPTAISGVSGIPVNWQRSRYNVKRASAAELSKLVTALDAKFLLVSFNDEGYISPAQMQGILSKVGRVTEFRMHYNTFRGSRNLDGRSIHVTEHLFLVKKKV